MVKEAHQTLMLEHDGLSARNNELQGELEAAYQEMAMFRKHSQVFGAPPRIIIDQEIQMEVGGVWDSPDKGIK